MRTPRFRRALMSSPIVAACLLVAGCKVVDSARQVRTVAVLIDLNATALRLSSSLGRPPDDREFWAAVTIEHMRTDSWGNPIQYAVVPQGEKPRFVIASPGKDAKFEFPSLADYVGKMYEDGTGRPTADLVIVDGQWVRGARK